jgi:thiamine biosynthesis lipoprotein
MGASFAFSAIGTHWQVDLPEEVSETRTRDLESRVRLRAEAFEAAYSRFRADSLLSRMSREPGTYDLPGDAVPLFALYQELHRLTGGAFTPLIGQTLVDAGYDPAYSLQPKAEVRAAPAWDDVLSLDGARLTVRQPCQLDLGAAGKGRLIDLVSELLEAEGVREYCVDAGGDIRHRGATPLRVGLEDPRDLARVLGVATVGDASICGSAGNRRAWKGYHHIIDPRTATSPTAIAAAWVMAGTTMLADALSTCVFFVPPESLRTRYAFSWLLLHEDGGVTASSDFPAELFTV